MRNFMVVLLLLTLYFTVSNQTFAQANTPDKMPPPASVRQNMLKEETATLMRKEASGTPFLKEQSFEKRKQNMLAHLTRIKKHLEQLKKKIESLSKLDSEIKTAVTNVINEHITWVEQQQEVITIATAETIQDSIQNIRDVWNVRKDMVYFYAGLVHLNKTYMVYERTNALYEKVLSENPNAATLSAAEASLNEAKTGLAEAKKIWTTLEDDVKPSELMSANNKQIKLVFESLRKTLTTLKQIQAQPLTEVTTTP